MPGLPDIYRNEKVGYCVLGFGVLMFLLFICCAAFMYFFQKAYPQLTIVLGAAWIVLVPVYFFVEHLFVFRRYGNPKQYEQFKRVQDLAMKIWAAAIVALAALYSGRF